eukprot:1654876-Alexandrium_andersonii.AAC.1
MPRACRWSLGANPGTLQVSGGVPVLFQELLREVDSVGGLPVSELEAASVHLPARHVGLPA